ncbi:cbb3-type cytochrome c oxidase subunit I, partial [Streptomyces panaciradicis]|uniref:cbb3-type cytochrome c oxidase subunit I n=1 Tax=Streptomyces panaciradicis TaxID=1470261 RepID=UPI00201CE040
MTEAPQLSQPTVPAHHALRNTLGAALLRWASTTDQKVIGRLYMVTAFCFFLLAGLPALAIRAEPALPGLQFMNEQTYNQLFTIHGTIMCRGMTCPPGCRTAAQVAAVRSGYPGPRRSGGVQRGAQGGDGL